MLHARGSFSLFYGGSRADENWSRKCSRAPLYADTGVAAVDTSSAAKRLGKRPLDTLNEGRYKPAHHETKRTQLKQLAICEWLWVGHSGERYLRPGPGRGTI